MREARDFESRSSAGHDFDAAAALAAELEREADDGATADADADAADDDAADAARPDATVANAPPVRRHPAASRGALPRALRSPRPHPSARIEACGPQRESVSFFAFVVVCVVR